MFRLFSDLFSGGRRTGRPTSCPQRRAQLDVENLETRLVPTASWTKAAILDFGGGNVTATQMAQGGWGNKGAQAVPSFYSLFDGSRKWLDMNGDQVVNGTDADIAINKILAKVREDYAPYKLEISLGNHDNYQFLLTDSTVGDVVVMVTGGRDFLTDQNNLGVSPTNGGDVGNTHDEIVWAFGDTMAGLNLNSGKFVNMVAETISHEMGHAFGLKHVEVDPSNDAMRHLIMGVPAASGGDGRDFNSDFNFQDITYAVEGGGTQNSHQYLTSTLGASTNAWAAVLRPGELTIKGSEWNDTIGVSRTSVYKWSMTINGVSKTLDHQGGLDSLNPFSTPLTSIAVYAGSGNDTITMDTSVRVDTYILAGAGNDTVYGGNGIDIICGELGRDWISGRDGNDLLFGGQDYDSLYGNAGVDTLYGENGNDRLDGGSDGVRDYLYGGLGADTFVAEKYYFGASIYQVKNRDLPADFNTLEGDYVDWGLVFALA